MSCHRQDVADRAKARGITIAREIDRDTKDAAGAFAPDVISALTHALAINQTVARLRQTDPYWAQLTAEEAHRSFLAHVANSAIQLRPEPATITITPNYH